MIKITLRIGSESTTHSFEKPVVTIGNGPKDRVDLAIPDDSLQAEHIKILLQNGRYLLINCANDPFVALNGLPFAKQKIASGDVIEVGKVKLFFEGDLPQTVVAKPEKTAQMIEAVEEEKAPPLVVQTPLPEPLSPEKRWQLLLQIVIPCLIFAILGAGITFLRFSGKSENQELKAARGLADIGMALTYAQVNHLKPVQQQWANPDFLDEMVQQVLCPELSSYARVDAGGHFENCPYMLRIYTSNNSAEFLAIAQPAPGLWQWLIPKVALIIDSESMQMHTLKDMKALNRLLVNTSSIDKTTLDKVAHILNKTPTISMKHLIDVEQLNGFQVPKLFKSQIPGVEQLIYNAPRYSPFSEGILSKALHLEKGPASSVDIATLQQQMEVLGKLHHLILYTSENRETAIAAKRALSTFVPSFQQINIGYLDPDRQGAQLFQEEIVAYVDREPFPLSSNKEEEEELIQHSHPLFLHLINLLHDRESDLRRSGDAMISLTSQQIKDELPDFEAQLATLLKEFQATSARHTRHIRKELMELYQEYSQLSLEEFMAYTEASGLTVFMKMVLAELDEQSLSSEDFKLRLQSVQEAPTFHTLHQAVLQLSEQLTLENISNPDALIAYQARLRGAVLSKLNLFLLSSHTPLAQESFTPETSTLLEEILSHSWIDDPEEADFYLSELNWHLQG